jgi:hypothetical protein
MLLAPLPCSKLRPWMLSRPPTPTRPPGLCSVRPQHMAVSLAMGVRRREDGSSRFLALASARVMYMKAEGLPLVQFPPTQPSLRLTSTACWPLAQTLVVL